MKTSLLLIATLSMSAFVAAAPDELEDSYTKLKDAVAKKDADTVKSAGAETLKLAQALVNAPKPSDADQVKDWEARVEYGKEVSAYTEYALGFTAAQGIEPAKTVELVDTLLAQNPKSKYLDLCAAAYLAALGKTGGAAKQLDGMAKIAAGRPDNEVALTALVEGYAAKSPDRALRYANQLISAMKTKAKPEGVSEADWEKAKNAALGTGYYYAGWISGQKQVWVDCDRNLRAALPYISNDASKLGPAYFSLGICNYNFGKLTADRTKMQAGQQFMEKSAGIKGAMQDQAYRQNLLMKQELATRR